MPPTAKLDPNTHTKPLRFFLATNKGNLKWFSLNTLAYICGDVAVLFATYFFGRVVDTLMTSGGDAKIYLIYTVVFLVSHEIFFRLGHICQIRALANLRQNTKKALFDHTSKLSFGYFADRFAGEIAHRVSNSADAIERICMIVSEDFIAAGALLLVAAFTIGTIHWYFIVFILFWGIFLLVGSYLISGEMNRRAGEFASEEASTTGSVVDVYGNIGAVKVYGSQESISSTHEQIDREKHAYIRLGWWDILSFLFQGSSVILMFIGNILIAAYLYQSGAISIGNIAFLASGSWLLYNIGWDMGRQVAEFTRQRGEMIQNLTDLIVAPTITDGPQSGLSKETVEVSYKHVSFSYFEDKPVLDNFSIDIKSGEKVGIVGLSGAGKTTFANLLLRFFDPQNGAITLNGIDIRQFTQEFLRSHISYISQDTSLFHDTISNNIKYGLSSASREEIKKAAVLAYADEFISTLPKSYDSVVGDRGIKLSGGQRQRIAIARAILADRPLFLLDEATSALDSDSEDKIQKGLSVLMENKTVIAIAHRLSTLSHMSRIVYLENGKIVEDGTHDELLKLNGKYAALWQMQAGGFLPTEVTNMAI